MLIILEYCLHLSWVVLTAYFPAECPANMCMLVQTINYMDLPEKHRSEEFLISSMEALHQRKSKYINYVKGLINKCKSFSSSTVY